MSGNINKVCNIREVSVLALVRIERGEFSHVVIRETLDENPSLLRRDRAFIKRIVTGTLSYRIQLEFILSKFVKKPIKGLKPFIRQTLLSSIYQLLYMDSVPDNAAVNEAVKLTAKRGFSGMKGFVNGVLRSIIRQRDELLTFEDSVSKIERMSIIYSMPEWIIKKWLASYSEETVCKICEEFLKDSSVTVRVNKAVNSIEECKKKLDLEGVSYRVHPYLDEALVLEKPDNMTSWDSFKMGCFAVQDISSILVNIVSDTFPGAKVLDLCAAPGGKSMHAAQLAGQAGAVISNDVSEKKTALILENCKRLKLNNIKTSVCDASKLKDDFIEKFDIVIADVPCSGLGVIGKKCDIKYRVQESELVELITLQRSILKNAVRYVKPGGTLLFSTCTINKDENEGTLKWLKTECGLRSVDISNYLPELLKTNYNETEGYLQLLPGINMSDGFFMARLIKK